MIRAAALLLFLVTQEDKGEQFYLFKKDTTWVLNQTFGKDTGRIELKVTSSESGKVDVESNETRGDRKRPTETIGWYVQDGYLCWGKVKDAKFTLQFRLYKLGSKKGDTWVGRDPMKDGDKPVDAEHLGTVEVTVPAGTYKDVTLVVMKDPNGMSVKFYLAPKVGIVKMEMTRNDKVEGNIELAEFKEGK